jgi:hypothetical protein
MSSQNNTVPQRLAEASLVRLRDETQHTAKVLSHLILATPTGEPATCYATCKFSAWQCRGC